MAEIAVPVVDLSAWTAGGSEDAKQAVVDQIREACEKCGFLTVVHHGIPTDVIDRVWKEVHDFFDLPKEIKEETNMADDYPYGYNGLEKETAGNDLKSGTYGAGDQKESWQMCLGAKAADGGEATYVPPVRWPSHRPEFKAAVTAYYRSLEGLSATLLRIFALALHLPENWFEDKTDKHWCALRTLNYPHQEKPPGPGALRISPHSDYGALTILRADDAPGGLQVMMKDGSWSDVRPLPDSFIINLGDLMQRWTNDRWMSTIHRVVNPTADVAALRDTRRQSIAFFHNVNREVQVTTIPTCIDADHPEKYATINAFEHLMERHAKSTGAAKAFTGTTSSTGSGAGATTETVTE